MRLCLTPSYFALPQFFRSYIFPSSDPTCSDTSPPVEDDIFGVSSSFATLLFNRVLWYDLCLVTSMSTSGAPNEKLVQPLLTTSLPSSSKMSFSFSLSKPLILVYILYRKGRTLVPGKRKSVLYSRPSMKVLLFNSLCVIIFSFT